MSHGSATAESASRAVAAYDRACHAIQLTRYGRTSAPVCQLSDETVAKLFAPQSFEKLIASSFYSPPVSCKQTAAASKKQAAAIQHRD